MASAQSSTDQQPSMKLCFVTVGATASFESLLTSVLDKSFLSALKQFGYTHLLVQFGKDGRPIFEKCLSDGLSAAKEVYGLQVDGFDFNKAGLQREIRLAQPDIKEGRSGGMIVSHAGSGSILEVLRLGIPLVVVPNPSLKDNHQEELAHELENQGYVVASHFKEISSAVGKAEALRSRMLAWPPGSSTNQIHKTALVDVMSDEMGFLD